MKTKTSSASVRTVAQEKAFGRLVDDMLKHIKTVALEKVPANREGWQRALERGDELRRAVTSAAIDKLLELCESPLCYLDSVTSPATKELVVSEELLKKQFNIGWLGENAKRLLLGKTLPATKEQALAFYELKKWQTGQQLKDQLGAGSIGIIPSMLALIGQQKNGPKSPKGALLVNQFTNIFVVELDDPGGRGGIVESSWAFCCSWYDYYGYWSVRAHEFGDEFVVERRVFSRGCRK